MLNLIILHVHHVHVKLNDMLLYYTGGMWDCTYDDVLDSADVVAIVEDEVGLTVNLSVNSTVDGLDASSSLRNITLSFPYSLQYDMMLIDLFD